MAAAHAASDQSAAPQYEYSSFALRGTGGYETRGALEGIRYGLAGDWWIDKSPETSDTVTLAADWVRYNPAGATPWERYIFRLGLGREQKKTVNEGFGFGHRGEMAMRAVSSGAWNGADFVNTLSTPLGASAASNGAIQLTNATVRDLGLGLGARYEGWARFTPGETVAVETGGGGEASVDLETWPGSTALPALRLSYNLFGRARLCLRLDHVEPYLEYRIDALRGEMNLFSTYNTVFAPAHSGTLGVRFFFSLLIFG